MTERTPAEHLDMMRSPERWPHVTILPLVNREAHWPREQGGWPAQGFLYQPSMQISCPPPEPVVYLGNIMTAADTIKHDRKKSYGSLQAVLDDGWRVD